MQLDVFARDARCPTTSKRSGRANQALPEPLTDRQRQEMIAKATVKLEELLEIFAIDHRSDPNTMDTAARVAKAFVDELLSGRYTKPPVITEFDGIQSAEGLVIAGPIDLRSMCSHHMMPIYGHVIIGILPGDSGRVIGLSKYDRIVDHFARRLQIQEELVRQIGEFIVAQARPRGLIVRVNAVHMCKTHRGVKGGHSGRMINTYAYGELQQEPLRREFLLECAALER